MPKARTTRREWCAGATAATFSMALPDPALPIIDTHTHFYDPTRKQGVPWPPKDDKLLYRTVLPAEFVRLAAPHGITGTIVVEASAWVDDNQFILDLARTNPVIKGLVGRLYPGQPGFAKQLEHYHRNPLFVGIRVPADTLKNHLSDSEFLAGAKLLATSGLTMDLLGPTSMLADTVRLNDAVPNLRIIIDHLPFDTQAQSPAFKQLRARPNVYAKVSDVNRTAGYRDRLDQVWEVFGEDRVVYGSNWPVNERFASFADAFATVNDYFTAKGPAVREKYFVKNAKSFYRWGTRH